MGNRIYGCDDCQLVCPWNKFAQAERRARLRACATGSTTRRSSSSSRGREEEFDERLAGCAIRRIGHERWLRNIAVALGNAPTPRRGRSPRCAPARDHPSALVREHVAWALERHRVAQRG